MYRSTSLNPALTAASASTTAAQRYAPSNRWLALGRSKRCSGTRARLVEYLPSKNWISQNRPNTEIAIIGSFSGTSGSFASGDSQRHNINAPPPCNKNRITVNSGTKYFSN